MYLTKKELIEMIEKHIPEDAMIDVEEILHRPEYSTIPYGNPVIPLCDIRGEMNIDFKYQR